MKRMMRGLAAGAALALAGVSGGCAGYGWEDVLHDGGGWGGIGASEIRGEVRDVEERNRVILLRRDDGRGTRVRYDSRTEVSHRGRRYRPSALERGDRVTVRVSRDRRGELYARHVYVRDSRDYGRYPERDRVPDRRNPDDRHRDGDGSYSERSAEGRVGRVDRANGRFQLRADGRTFWVTLPYRTSREVRDRFSRLREGDYVRVSGRFLSRDRFEIDRFR